MEVNESSDSNTNSETSTCIEDEVILVYPH